MVEHVKHIPLLVFMRLRFRFPVLLPLVGTASFLLLGGHALAAISPHATMGGPGNGQQGVPVDARVDRAIVGEGGAENIVLSGATVTVSTILLRANTGNTQMGAAAGSNLCTSVSLEWGRMVVCDHTSLASETWYTFTIKGGSGGIKSQLPDVQTMAADQNYVFRTGGFQGGNNFLPPPSIIGGVPRPGAVVPINAKLRVYFNVGGTGATTLKTTGVNSVLSRRNVSIMEVVDGEPQDVNLLGCANTSNCNMSWNSTGSELIVTPGKKAPAGSVSYYATGALVAGHKYLFMVEGSGGPGGVPGVQNTAGMTIMGQPFFTMFTATGADAAGPTVRATYPVHEATGVDRAIYDISIGFSEAVDPGTVSGSSVLLYVETAGAGFNAAQDTLVTTTYVSYTTRDNTAHLSPSTLLAASTTYYIVVTTGVKDMAGNALASQAVKSFTTGTSVNGGSPGVADGTAPRITGINADNFSIAVTFSEPMQYDASVNKAKTSSSVINAVNNARNWKLVMTPEGFTYDLTQNGRTVTYDPPSRTLVFGGLMMPPNQGILIKAQTASGVTRVRDLSANLLTPVIATGSVRSMEETKGMLLPGEEGGEFNFFQNGLRPKMVMPMAPMAGATTNYEVMLSTSQVIPLGGTIVFTFPTGFSTAASCATKASVPDNNDINGSNTGTVGIASIACSNIDRSVTVTTNGAATQVQDMLRFVLQGIVNTPVPSSQGSEGSRVDIKTKNIAGTVLETLTSMPIFIAQGGSRSISGTVFKDNGAGVGTANDGIKNGSEPGVQLVKVCMNGPMANNCADTAADGTFSFTSLNDGFYNLTVPPLSSGSLFVNGSTFRDVRLSGSNATENDFGLTSTSQNINVRITGIPADTALDVFAFLQNSSKAGNVVRELDYTAASRTVTLPVSAGTWMVGVGPRMNKDPSLGGSGPPPVFNFMPPQPKNVMVPAGTGANVVFALMSATNQIKGKVVIGSGSALANAFIMARPATMGSDMGKEGVGQSKPDGTFVLFVSSGAYTVQAQMPGMPPSASVPVLVKPNSDGTDGNTAADVYMNGSLVTGANPLKLVILQGGLSISGKIMDESGNAVPYAQVQAMKKTSGSFNGVFSDAPSGNDGTYTVYVSPGTWDLTAFVPGYGRLPEMQVVVTNQSVTGQNLQASAANFGTVTGTVTQSSSGIGGAHVNLFGSNGGNQTSTATDGSYTMKVRAGTYTIEGFLPGTGPTTSSGITVTAGGTVTVRALTIAAAGTLTVTIAGVTDAYVRAEASNGKGNGTSATATGVYVLSVPAGTYTVRAQSPSLGLIGSRSVTVSGGGTTTTSFTPATTYAVTGTVTSSNANCTINASVGFADATSGRATVATTAANGTYSLQLPNGTFRIMAGNPNAGCVDSTAPSTVTVNGAAVSIGNRALSPSTTTITGRVTLNGAAVTIPTKVIGKGSDNRYIFADVSSGTYVLRVTAGTWTIQARSDGYQSSTVDVEGGGSQNLTLSALAGYTRQEPLSTSVTPTAGGMVKNSTIGSGFELNIPAGALGTSSNSNPVSTAPTTAFVSLTSTARVVGTSVVEVTRKDENGQTKSGLETPATITIPVTQAALTAAGVSDITKLTIGTWNDSTGSWDPLSTTVDATNKTLTAVVEHFSTFAPISPQGGGAAAAPAGDSPAGTTARTGGGGGGLRRFVITTATGATVVVTLPAHVITKEKLRSVRNLVQVTVGGTELVLKDVPADAWFASYVATVIESGLASGYKNAQGELTGLFGPGNPVTYAEIAKMALEAAGESVGTTTGLQNRSAAGEWSASYIKRAEDLGLTVYASDLNVNAPSPRGAVMHTLVELLGIKEQPAAPATPATPATTTGTGGVTVTTGSGTMTTGSGTVTTGSGTTATGTGTVTAPAAPAAPAVTETPAPTFKDLPENHPFAPAINLLAKLGVISGDTTLSGKPKGTVRPAAAINRGEVAKILTKLIELRFIK